MSMLDSGRQLRHKGDHQHMNSSAALPPDLRDLVLSELGFSQAPALDTAGLHTLYAAWCHHVPFDNLCKLIHIFDANPAALPGNNAIDFFQTWLKHKTGGTCWAGNGALQALLSSLGFTANRGVATMLVAPGLPPNHGTVIVDIEDRQYLTDASILHLVPMELTNNLGPKIPFNIKLERHDDDLWYALWTPFNYLNGLQCRLDYHPASDEDFQQRHEQTRAWGPFNYQLTVRGVRDRQTIGTMGGKWFHQSDNGDTQQRSVSNSERKELLINTMGYSEEIVSRLPEDRPTPPPPGSKTAASLAKGQE